MSKHKNAGVNAIRSGYPTDAIRHLLDALKMCPQDAAVHGYLGVAYGQIGQSEKALAHLTQATQLAPGQAPFWYNLGLAQEAYGNRESAIVSFRRAVALDAGHQPANQAVSRLSAIDETVRNGSVGPTNVKDFHTTLPANRAITGHSPRKRILISLTLSALLISVISGGIIFWSQLVSPEYSLRRLRGAIDGRDLATFGKLVDVDTTSERFVDEYLQTLLDSESKDPNDFSKRFEVSRTVHEIRPKMVDGLRQQILYYIENGEFGASNASEHSQTGLLPVSALYDGQITRIRIGKAKLTGKTAEVPLLLYRSDLKLELPLVLQMRSKGMYWQVTQIRLTDYVRKLELLRETRRKQLNAPVISAINRIIIPVNIEKVVLRPESKMGTAARVSLAFKNISSFPVESLTATVFISSSYLTRTIELHLSLPENAKILPDRIGIATWDRYSAGGDFQDLIDSDADYLKFRCQVTFLETGDKKSYSITGDASSSVPVSPTTSHITPLPRYRFPLGLEISEQGARSIIPASEWDAYINMKSTGYVIPPLGQKLYPLFGYVDGSFGSDNDVARYFISVERGKWWAVQNYLNRNQIDVLSVDENAIWRGFR